MRLILATVLTIASPVFSEWVQLVPLPAPTPIPSPFPEHSTSERARFTITKDSEVTLSPRTRRTFPTLEPFTLPGNRGIWKYATKEPPTPPSSTGYWKFTSDPDVQWKVSSTSELPDGRWKFSTKFPSSTSSATTRSVWKSQKESTTPSTPFWKLTEASTSSQGLRTLSTKEISVSTWKPHFSTDFSTAGNSQVTSELPLAVAPSRTIKEDPSTSPPPSSTSSSTPKVTLIPTVVTVASSFLNSSAAGGNAELAGEVAERMIAQLQAAHKELRDTLWESKKEPKTLKQKMQYLTKLRNHILKEIARTMMGLNREDANRDRRIKRGANFWSNGTTDIGFPSIEAALLTLCFLVFGVFLVNMVLVLFSNLFTTTTTNNTTGTGTGKRRRRSVDITPEEIEATVRVLQAVHQFPVGYLSRRSRAHAQPYCLADRTDPTICRNNMNDERTTMPQIARFLLDMKR